MAVRVLLAGLVVVMIPHLAAADELLYAYECDVFPLEDAEPWVRGGWCDDQCIEYIDNGHFVYEWQGFDITYYDYEIARPPEPGPPTLWIEWRFRSNEPRPPHLYGCDGDFTIHYAGIDEVVYMHGDSAVSFSGDYWVGGLDIDEFHTYRFESLDGVHYWISVDGLVFIDRADDTGNGYHFFQFGGTGGCSAPPPFQINEWDYMRFGTISSGEVVIATDPPSGFVDSELYPTLDRFAVTFESPNYVYIDEITIEVSGGSLPEVIRTWRRENDEPDTFEIVLDQPIPPGEHTRFLFLARDENGDLTDVVANVVNYSYIPGDADGNGRINLADVAEFQRCFGETDVTGRCAAFDFNDDNTVDLTDYPEFQAALSLPGPGP